MNYALMNQSPFLTRCFGVVDNGAETRQFLFAEADVRWHVDGEVHAFFGVVGAEVEHDVGVFAVVKEDGHKNGIGTRVAAVEVERFCQFRLAVGDCYAGLVAVENVVEAVFQPAHLCVVFQLYESFLAVGVECVAQEVEHHSQHGKHRHQFGLAERCGQQRYCHWNKVGLVYSLVHG